VYEKCGKVVGITVQIFRLPWSDCNSHCVCTCHWNPITQKLLLIGYALFTPL